MLWFRIPVMAIGLALVSSMASAQPSADTVKAAVGASLCVPGTKVEALSEGAWYPAVVLDALRDGRCFVHYEGYGADDDEAMGPGTIRAAR